MSLSCNVETKAQGKIKLFGQVLLKRYQLQNVETTFLSIPNS